MNNHTCIECGHAFTWKNIFKNIWTAYKPMKCQKCSKTYKVTNGSQALVTLLVIVPMLVFGELLSMLSLLPKLSIMIFVGFFISLFVPFLLKYKQEPVNKN
ncbi:TIGR04104 family putative zinc finger protein [Bacillus pinisoli]|uniref:TIGR04104 family putative zinc finger protein n=1 Tax=Bacillus pinisoli TaxID=2901866 RepID=UPI001FF1D0F9|nr:TIGR04104 family putative zinc finger protein [Bacillus pinisoli]